jgi:hypothetical protein
MPVNPARHFTAHESVRTTELLTGERKSNYSMYARFGNRESVKVPIFASYYLFRR